MAHPSTLPLTAEQQVWFDQQTKRSRPEMLNPCVKAYGLGPEGEICKHCSHLYRNWRQKAYIKCDLRTHTNGPGSDHKARWQACGKFEPVKVVKVKVVNLGAPSR